MDFTVIDKNTDKVEFTIKASTFKKVYAIIQDRERKPYLVKGNKQVREYFWVQLGSQWNLVWRNVTKTEERFQQAIKNQKVFLESQW